MSNFNMPTFRNRLRCFAKSQKRSVRTLSKTWAQEFSAWCSLQSKIYQADKEAIGTFDQWLRGKYA